MKLKLHKLLLLPLFVSVGGCSMFFETTPVKPQEQVVSTEEDTDDSARAALRVEHPSSVSSVGGEIEVPGVEVVWQAPLKPVEVYHLRYGFAEAEINQELTIPVDKLDRLDHPEYGPVYRYTLRNVPKNREIFVTLQAENRVGMSQPSKVMKIAAVP